jgi:DNA polymerase alpha subunit B
LHFVVCVMTSSEIPPALRKLLSSFSADCQARLTELHKLFQFTADELECFQLNHGSLNFEKIQSFQIFLEQEKKNRALKKSVAASKGARTSESGLKRRSVATPALSVLSDAVAAISGIETKAEVTTPAAKKPREAESADGNPARGTPDPLPKPLQVSLKSSFNEKLEKPTVPLPIPAVVKLLGNEALWIGHRHGSYTWMDESLADRAARRDERLQDFEGHIIAAVQAKKSGEAIEVGTVGVPRQADTLLCGRLACEGLEGRFNERSMLLEGSRASASGARVQLNVAECSQFAAFPGQIVSVVGRSGMAGTTFHAREFVAGLPLPQSGPTAGSLHMVVVSGPFCLRDCLDYGPLESALEHAAKVRPQVLVIQGPFLDANNQKVLSGDTCLAGEQEPRCFEEIYAQVILPLLQRCITPLRRANPPTEVIIVPSLDEVLCFHPLPQPPLTASIRGSQMEQLSRLGVHFVPNPAHVEINGVKVSFTSADALSPVLREIVLRGDGKKIEEALKLLLLQRNLFPVVPRDPAQVCEARAEALEFPDAAVPDICVFPSMSGVPNGTVVENTVFLNPGSLCRPAALGSFGELWLAPAGSTPIALKERVRVDIHKIG